MVSTSRPGSGELDWQNVAVPAARRCTDGQPLRNGHCSGGLGCARLCNVPGSARSFALAVALGLTPAVSAGLLL